MANKPLAKRVAKKNQGPYKMAEEMPIGSVVTDFCKQSWELGKIIGKGGFGLVYLAKKLGKENNFDYVLKMEPNENGPLFCEMACFTRILKQKDVQQYMRMHRLKHLGIPEFASSGNHSIGTKNKLRFIVMERFHSDLQQIIDKHSVFPVATNVFIVALQMIESLKYLHSNGFAHADIKAANMMTSRSNPNQVYLIDYGLAFRFKIEGKHTKYFEDPKRAHDGTAEFASRDAHRGVLPSARGDLESLGYCLWLWLVGWLPWMQNLEDKEYVANKKNEYMEDIKNKVTPLLKNKHGAEGMTSYLEYVNKLDYDGEVDYDKIKRIFKTTLTRMGCKNYDVFETSVRKRTKLLSKPSDDEDEEDDDKDDLEVESEVDKEIIKKRIPNKYKKISQISSPPNTRRSRSQLINKSPSLNPKVALVRLNDELFSELGKPRKVKRKYGIQVSTIGTQTSPGLKNLLRSHKIFS